jgi:AcrR family transcriptional regulator
VPPIVMNNPFPRSEDKDPLVAAGTAARQAKPATAEAGGRRGAGEDPQKREQIMAGAREVFGALGFDTASMSDVTRAAGVSKSTLYVYFRSKEELFTALIADERERYFAQIEKIFSDTSHPEETLRTYGILLATKLTSEKVVRASRTVIAVADRMPDVGRDFYEEGPQRGVRLLAHYLSAAHDAGTLTVADPHRAAIQFIELSMAGLYRPRLFNHVASDPVPAEIETVVDSAVALFMAGYGPRRR